MSGDVDCVRIKKQEGDFNMKNFKCDEGHLSLFLNAIFSKEKIYDSYRESIIAFTTECAWEEHEELQRAEQMRALKDVLTSYRDERKLCQDYLEERGSFQKHANQKSR